MKVWFHMKYFSVCSLFPLELFNEEKCFAFPAALGFLLLYKSSTTERQWEDDSLWEPLFVQMMDSMNSNGNFFVLWASAWILTKNHPVGWERCSSPLLIYSPASLPHLMRSDEFPCSLFSCTLETGWLSVITFFTGHRAVAAAMVTACVSGPRWAPHQSNSFHHVAAWKILPLNLTGGTKHFNSRCSFSTFSTS